MVNEFKHPTTDYVSSPNAKSLSNLRELRFKTNREALLSLDRHPMDAYARINERENAILRAGSQTYRKTLNEVKDKRRQDLINANMQKFSKNLIGIHGKELP